MPSMSSLKALRLEPDGAKSNVTARPGNIVEVLETKGQWTRVRLVDVPNQPVGWVLSDAIDLQDALPTASVDREHFAEQCLLQSLFFGTSAHYMMAVAQLRSGVSAANEGQDIGPFRIRRSELEAHSSAEDFELALGASAATDWRLQCAAFALMTRRCQDNFVAFLDGRRPTAAELYLAQLIGAPGAAKVLKDPSSSLESIVQGLQPNEAPPGAPAGESPIERFSSLLKRNGVVLVGKDALDNIADALDLALKATRGEIEKAGAQILEPEAPTVTEEVAPEAVLFRQATAANAAPVKGHLIEAMQRALVASGNLPERDEAGRHNVDGVFGRRTAEALKVWQGKMQFGITGAITFAQWRELLNSTPPDIYHRCAQLTASFEGTGFSGVNSTDFDHTVLTFGYHGYTITGGNLQKFIRTFDEKFPAQLEKAFGPAKAAELREMVKKKTEQSVSDARAMFLDGQKVKEEWRVAFQAFGDLKECRDLQLEFTRDVYWSDAMKFSQVLGLSEPLSLALCFDVAVQNGKKLKVAKSVAAKFKSGMSEQDKRLMFAEGIVAAVEFKVDTRRRKVDTLSDGEGIVHEAHYDLRDWGFSSSESRESDPPANFSPVSINTDFETWFSQNVPNSSLPARAFLAKGGAHERNHLNTDPPRALWPNVIKLAQVLTELKRRLGDPRIDLTSVYRNRRYNESVGGARASMHMSFKAADLIVHDGRGPADWAAVLKGMRREGLFAGGIGIYRTFCHIDVRGENKDW